MNGTVEPGFYANPVYQWQSSTDSLSWTDIPGATQTNYSLPGVQISDGRYYRLLIAEWEYQPDQLPDRFQDFASCCA
jgi:hypothetical protein